MRHKIKFIHPSYQGNKGFSLTEMLVSMTVGMLVFAGVIGLLVASNETVSDTVQRGEMQENGRLALTLVSQDIMLAGYYGQFTGMDIHEASSADTEIVKLNQVNGNKVAVEGTDCVGDGENNGTFFVENSDFFFRHIWSTHTESSSIFNCISSAISNTDVLQIKRVLGDEISAGEELDTRYYLISTDNQAVFYAGSDATPVVNNGVISEYQHHIYYIENESRGSVSVPILKRKYLYKTENSTGNQAKLKAQTLVEGIERMGFLFGIDSDSDGTVNYYAKAEELTREHWENDGSEILAIKAYILVRALEPDNKITNTKVYDMGSYLYTVNDNYRRMLFINTVKIINAGKEVWRS
ncbi:hypothetical protein XM47_11790 [Catenovulum maritimum]|uniref:Pilus assembly protein PilW n=2 Tax=Catenovulum maritimum TaxID=1513271 RepID=A0A0J8GQ60_9ALTE|nr:hypothetical protein XM47_11790 [Catenovulum maritimum]